MTTCNVHSEVESVATCDSCGAAMCEDCIGEVKGSVFTCRECMAAAATDTAESEEQPPQELEVTRPVISQDQDTDSRPVALVVILAISVGILAYQQLFATGRTVEPGSYYATEEQQAQAMQCYNNLYSIADLLQAGDTTGIEAMRCPIHGQPYIIQMIEGDMVVIDPEPTAIGFRDIRVARSIGMPEFTPLAN